MSTSMKKTGGCGCGCGGTSDCGCGGSGGTPICVDSSFKRPRFFAGQLLTEDDLQALTDYVVGKNRLHNRFLFGDGVVCGLTVTCNPCDRGHVTVAPGFALDCCGNDLLLACKEDLDVKALLRDLRKRQLAGYDCGDPCDDKDGNERTYGLYLKYTETPAEPVAPYTAGEPCGQQSCEPSRICEGYRFELRCDCAQPERTDLFKRVRACIGDLARATAAISKAQTAHVQAYQFERAAAAIDSGAAVPFDADSVRALRETPRELASFNSISLAPDAVDANGVPTRKPDERSLRLEVARLQLLTGAVTRYRILSDKDRRAALKAYPEIAALVRDAESTVTDANARMAVLAPRVMTTPAARTEAEETVRLAQKYVLDQNPSPERFETAEARFVSLNTPMSYKQSAQMTSDLSLLKDWLLDRLEGATSLTRCDLYERLRRIPVGDTAGDANGEVQSIRTTSRSVRQIVQILFEYLIDCICLALNPPCQPCEDQGVLLACLTVTDCEVVDICNMSRRFVLTPVAIRYWLPPIGALGDFFERLCCEFDVGKLFGERAKEPAETPREQIAQMVAAKPEELPITKTFAPTIALDGVDQDVALALQRFKIEPREIETVTAFSSNLALLSARTAAIDPAGLAVRGAALTQFVTGRVRDPLAGAADNEILRARVAKIVEGEAAEARKNIERDVSARFAHTVDATVAALRKSVTEDVTKGVEDTVGKRVTKEIEVAVERGLATTKLDRAVESTAAIKTLREDNRKLNRDLKTMADALARLTKGANP